MVMGSNQNSVLLAIRYCCLYQKDYHIPSQTYGIENKTEYYDWSP